MTDLPCKIILASASPRRVELLRTIVPTFEQRVSGADETIAEGMPPYQAVATLSARKAEDAAGPLKAEEGQNGAVIIGADTVVAVDSRILGKPADTVEAAAMLTFLAGREHQVYTGVTLLGKRRGETFRKTFTECTSVQIAPLTQREIDAYVMTGEPMDKAGAYAIQGLFAKHVTGIRGDYNNVVGLPVSRLYLELRLLLCKMIDKPAAGVI